MSQNRAVQAAQRRRAGGPEPAPPGRGPQPSINSSQMFAQGQQGQGQIRPGTSGRLAGQQAQLQQQQMQQQMHQQMQEPKDQGLASVNRMTLAQAITLITLRLGKVETHLHEQDQSHFANPGLDSGIIDVIMSRLEALETQSQSQVSNASVSSSVSNSVSNSVTTLEVSTMKQNIDLLKTAIAQSKSTIVGLTNEHRTLKSEVESLKSELAALQGLAMENNQQIMKLSLAVDLEEEEQDVNLEEEESNDEEEVSNDDSEIVGTDLKDLIEKELKL
jgi:hypothetical protein